MNKKKLSKGFSLLEVSLVIALLATLSGLSVIGWQHWLQAQRQRLAVEKLQQILQFAQRAALVRNQYVAVCPQGGNEKCGDNWAEGVIVYTDTALPRALQAHNIIWQTYGMLPKGKIVWRGWLQHTIVRFNPDGLPHSYHGSFYLDQSGQLKELLVMNNVGRLRP